MQCKCIICGTMFNKSPSDNVLTCSPECSRRRRSEALTGHSVSDETRHKISSAATERGFTENLAKGTPAARNSPKGGRFDTNASAKSWTLTSPDGRQFTCTNLNNWIRTHADLFGTEPTDDNVRRVSAGFRVIKRNIKRNRGGQTYKGWRIDDWDDRKNHEKGENHMKKFDVEMATITGWDADAIQDYVEAIDAEEAMDLARDYLRDCIISNGGDPDEEEIVLRAREVINDECGDFGEWIYE